MASETDNKALVTETSERGQPIPPEILKSIGGDTKNKSGQQNKSAVKTSNSKTRLPEKQNE